MERAQSYSDKNKFMESLSIDQPTLRIHLDRLVQDKGILVKRLEEEQGKLKALQDTIEQYKGAIGYNQGLIDSVAKDLEQLNAAAFSKEARSIKDQVVTSQ